MNLLSPPLQRLWQYISRYRLRLFGGGACVLAASSCSQAVIWQIKIIVDSLAAGFDSRAVGKQVLVLVLFALVGGIFTFWMRIIMVRTSRLLEYHLRNDLFLHLLSLPRQFYNQMRTGDIMSRATEDINAVRMLLGPAIMYSINTVSTFVLAVAMMFQLSPRLTFWVFFPLIMLTALIKVGSKAVAQCFRDGQIALAEITAAAQENISGIRVVKSYGREQAETATFTAKSNTYMETQLALARIWGLFFPVLWLTAGVEMVLVIVVGGAEVVAGNMTVGALAAFMGYLGILIWPMTALGWVINLFQRGVVSMGRIEELFAAPERIDTGTHAPAKAAVSGRLEFRQINFSYQPGKPILQDIDLVVPAGSVLGIVGRTGAGKSSLVQLLLRLYEPDSGECTLDGVLLSEYSRAALSRIIGYVSQEPFLFSRSIADNIAYGMDPEASLADRDAAVRQAAELALMDSEIAKMPAGYQSLLGERGINLSGGQKQRLTIARTLAGQPRVLVLDDCLSSVDADTEQQIRNNLLRQAGGCTIVIISHRISTVQSADQIIYLEDGRITEAGSHSDLVAKEGGYWHLYRQQQLEQDLQHLEPAS